MNFFPENCLPLSIFISLRLNKITKIIEKDFSKIAYLPVVAVIMTAVKVYNY